MAEWFPQDLTALASRKVTSNLTNVDTLSPWYINYQGGSWVEATQCTGAGSNGWQANHAALDGGLNDMWVVNNTPISWSYFKKSDLPVQFSIAEGWTVGDMYQVGCELFVMNLSSMLFFAADDDCYTSKQLLHRQIPIVLLG